MRWIAGLNIMRSLIYLLMSTENGTAVVSVPVMLSTIDVRDLRLVCSASSFKRSEEIKSIVRLIMSYTMSFEHYVFIHTIAQDNSHGKL